MKHRYFWTPELNDLQKFWIEIAASRNKQPSLDVPFIHKCSRFPSVFWKPQDPWLPRAKAESPGVMADIREMLKDSRWNGTVVLHFFVKKSFTSWWSVVYICCIVLLFLFGIGLVSCAQRDCSHKGLGNEDMNWQKIWRVVFKSRVREICSVDFIWFYLLLVLDNKTSFTDSKHEKKTLWGLGQCGSSYPPRLHVRLPFSSVHRMVFMLFMSLVALVFRLESLQSLRGPWAGSFSSPLDRLLCTGTGRMGPGSKWKDTSLFWTCLFNRDPYHGLL